MFLTISLLVIELIFFIIAETYLFKRDLPFAFYFAALYLYSTPALIGYYFFPALSIKISAYFGEEYWIKFYIFIVLSMISFFAFSVHYIRKLERRQIYRDRKLYFVDHGSLFSIAIIFVLISDAIQMVNLVVNSTNIGYMISSSTNALTRIGIILFGLNVGVILILYYFIRSKKFKQNRHTHVIIIFILSLAIFLLYGIRSGNRHVMLQIALGILFLEIKLKYLNRRTMIRYGILLFILLIAFQSLRSSRSNALYEMSFSFENLLSNDYYPPAHMLFTAIRYNVIEPLTVIKSNFANALFGLNFDYLQKELMERIVTFSVTRNASYALFVFAEGYMFIGWGGYSTTALS